MKVVISEAVVTAAIGTPQEIDLQKLLIFGCEGRHVLLFEDRSALEACLDTVASKTRPHYLEALKHMPRNAAALPADVATIQVEVTNSPVWDDPVATLPLDIALIVLAEPLGVLLENATNDWSFLYGMMRPSERERVKQAVSKGWVKILHGGGSSLRTELPRRLAMPEQGLRTFVLFDSDRRHPDELAPTWSPEGSEACLGYELQQLMHPELQLRHWMLLRRNIESYIPETEMRKGLSPNTEPEAVSAFFRMSEPARWYFNMKKGFKGDQAVENAHRCRDLYDHVNQDDRNALHRGFGRTLADQYQQTENNEFHWDAEALQEASDALPRLLRLL